MPEKIFMTSTNATAVPYEGTTLGHHIVLNYIDADGYHHTLQGTPVNTFQHNFEKLGAFFREEALSDGVNNTDSPFGRLKVDPEAINSDTSLSQPYTMIAEGNDLSPHWALMRDFADEVNSTGYEYRPMSQNSNSFAAGALQRAGLLGPGSQFPERFNRQSAFDPETGQSGPRYVPGFEQPLTNPIDMAMPMPFPLDVFTARPAGAATVPDRRGSLDGGSGNQAFGAPMREPAPEDRPMRYLGRQTYSPSPGPNQSPAVPLNLASTPQPSDNGPLTLMEAYQQYRKRLDASQPQASAFDTAAPSAPLAPSDDSNFSGGLVGRLTALMRQYPEIYGPSPPEDDESPSYYRWMSNP